jgi:transposase InsO family protein
MHHLPHLVLQSRVRIIADQLQQLLTRLRLIACHIPCRSPQSNGLVESFFGSFKRDYLSHQPLETLAAAMKLIPAWFTHYNEVAPQSTLAMLSPTTFYQRSLTESHTLNYINTLSSFNWVSPVAWCKEGRRQRLIS